MEKECETSGNECLNVDDYHVRPNTEKIIPTL